jgi:ribosomal protein S18 acetylase RimI-like enzyme
VTTVRPATADDVGAVRRVWEEVAAEGEWIGAELPLRPDWSERFLAGIEDEATGFFVAVVDVMIVGGIFVGDDGGIVHVGMAIVDGHRGQGIGRRLLDAGVDWARRRGAHKLALEVWPHNERARALYRSAGFVDEGRFLRHYRRRDGALWDVVAMGLVLDTEAPGRP